jgi:hypothetical protein
MRGILASARRRYVPGATCSRLPRDPFGVRRSASAGRCLGRAPGSLSSPAFADLTAPVAERYRRREGQSQGGRGWSCFEQIKAGQTGRGLSIRQLTGKHRVHRRTVQQALASAVPPARKPYPRRPRLHGRHAAARGSRPADRGHNRKGLHHAATVGQAVGDARPAIPGVADRCGEPLPVVALRQRTLPRRCCRYGAISGDRAPRVWLPPRSGRSCAISCPRGSTRCPQIISRGCTNATANAHYERLRSVPVP